MFFKYLHRQIRRLHFLPSLIPNRLFFNWPGKMNTRKTCVVSGQVKQWNSQCRVRAGETRVVSGQVKQWNSQCRVGAGETVEQPVCCAEDLGTGNP